MKKVILTLIFLSIAFSLTSCTPDNTADEKKGIRLFAVDAECKKQLLTAETIESSNISYFHVSIFDKQGVKQVWKTFTSVSSSMKFEDLDEMEGATLLFKAYIDVAGAEESVEKWVGQATNISFKNGKTTSVDIVLYPAEGSACLPESLGEARFGHHVLKLDDGRLLVTGGFSECSSSKCDATKSVEIIDVEMGTVSTLKPMLEERAFHTAVALSDGRVVIAGGVKELTKEKHEMSFLPDFPFTLSKISTVIELYTPSYPKANVDQSWYGGKVMANAVTELSTDNASAFFPYQSYIYSPTGETSGHTGTIFMVGGVENNSANDRIFGIEIIEGSNLSIGVKTYITHLGSDNQIEKMICPQLTRTHENGKIFFSGGKTSEADYKYAGTLTSERLSPWSGTGNVPKNTFFAAARNNGSHSYVSGGAYFVEDEEPVLTPNNLVFNFDTEENKMTQGTLESAVVFHSMELLTKEDNGEDVDFGVVIGGSESVETIKAVKTIQIIDLNTFLRKESLELLEPRVFAATSASDVITHNSKEKSVQITVVGGTTSLNTAPTNSIEIVTVK